MAKDIMGRLEDWRHGPLGTIMFYGYLVAIVVTGVLAVMTWNGLHRASDRLDRNTSALEAQTRRSCMAIDGATAFWREIRAVSQVRKSDPDRSPTQLSADERLIDALTRVISRGDQLSCKDRP
jgi:hypothetical protein